MRKNCSAFLPASTDTHTMTATAQPTQVHVPFDELRALLQQIFEHNGCSAQVAAVLADNCASAQRDGAQSHGVFRMAGYVSTLKSGWVDGKAVPVVEDKAPGFLSVDAANGFAQPAFFAAKDRLIAKARTNGIALLAIQGSHHFAALWPDVEPLAREGLVARERRIGARGRGLMARARCRAPRNTAREPAQLEYTLSIEREGLAALVARAARPASVVMPRRFA